MDSVVRGRQGAALLVASLDSRTAAGVSDASAMPAMKRTFASRISGRASSPDHTRIASPDMQLTVDWGNQH